MNISSQLKAHRLLNVIEIQIYNFKTINRCFAIEILAFVIIFVARIAVEVHEM